MSSFFNLELEDISRNNCTENSAMETANCEALSGLVGPLLKEIGTEQFLLANVHSYDIMNRYDSADVSKLGFGYFGVFGSRNALVEE